MLAGTVISIVAWWELAAGLSLVAVAIGTGWMREMRPGRVATAMAVVGGVLLAVAAGRPTWNRGVQKWVAVMVDVSPSTRGAAYRNRAALERRLGALLGNVPYRLVYFADGPTEPATSGDLLADAPSEKTVLLAASGAAAVLLFSDCRFELPTQFVPTYIVTDPQLEDVADASVSSLEVRQSEARAAFTNSGNVRGVTLRGVRGGTMSSAPHGSVVLSRFVAPGTGTVAAQLTPGDRWPENDGLSATVPPPESLERWWVGNGNPPATWRALSPTELPTDAAAYLGAGVIVLDDVSASDLTDIQQQRLAQYVRDSGGGLVVLGGDRAFGAGGYTGTVLDGVLPLASRPPEPTTHWVVLVDASGSMGGDVAGGGTRWDFAGRAVRAVVGALPPEDLVSAGGFAEGVNWWAEGKRVKDLTATPLPPAGTFPHGPTNLEPALDAVLGLRGTMPVQVLVISDFDAKLSDAGGLAERFKARKIPVHVLAIGEGSALPAMQAICSNTGGASMTQLDPAKWTTSARELLHAAMPTLVRRDAVTVTFANALTSLGRPQAKIWNRTWLKQGATQLAQTADGPDQAPMAAKWNLGEGQVTAAAFEPAVADTTALADLVARKPRDPRFRVSWEVGRKLHVAVDAVAEGKFLNRETVTLELAEEGSGTVKPVTQTGPGRYEVSVDAPRSAKVATVRVDGNAIERFGVAGRYAPEFDAVGNDHAAMEELARRTGGRVIGVGDNGRIGIDWPVERVGLESEFAVAGAAMLLGGLWRWRRSWEMEKGGDRAPPLREYADEV